MTMLVITDPTPTAVAFDVSPRAYAWTERCEDLSGLDVSGDDWIDLEKPPETFRALLSEIGRVYAPFMLANADAVARGAAQVNGVEARARDGLAIRAEPAITITASEDAELVMVEVADS